MSNKPNHPILKSIFGAALAMAVAAVALGQTTPAAAPAAAVSAPAEPAADAPAPLSTFVLTGPLQWMPPATFDAGPLGKLSVNGILTGFSQFQSNHVPGDEGAQATLSNGEIFIQKAGREGSVLYPGGRLHHAGTFGAVCQRPNYEHQFLRACSESPI